MQYVFDIVYQQHYHITDQTWSFHFTLIRNPSDIGPVGLLDLEKSRNVIFHNTNSLMKFNDNLKYQTEGIPHV